MKHLGTYLIGLIFGVGISMSGMANPAKVLNFFDVAGSWDPSLALAMGGAVTVAFLGYRLVLSRPRTAFEPTFDIPTNRRIDARLISGSALFGVGWGIAGFCPGGALPAIGTLDPRVVLFVIALIGGLLMATAAMRLTARLSHSPS